MALNVGNLIQFLIDKNRSGDTQRLERLYYKFIHDSNFELHMNGEWDFDLRYVDLNFIAPYSTGTIQKTNFSGNIAGTGTNWVNPTNVIENECTLRANGENNYFNIGTVSSPTSLVLNPIYYGESVSGVNYIITHDRKLLNVKVRSVFKIQSSDWPSPLTPAALIDIDWLKKFSKEVGLPRIYSIDSQESSGDPKTYLMLYPPPSQAMLVRMFYIAWPDEITTATPDATKFGIPLAAEPLLKELCLAYLDEEQKGVPSPRRQTTIPNMFAQLGGAHRLRTEAMMKQYAQLTMQGGFGPNPLTASVAPGEPFYT